MAQRRSAGLRMIRHGSNVAGMLEAARQVAGSRLSAEQAVARGLDATVLEYGRMVPEKLLAFSAAQAALWQGGTRLMQRGMEYGFGEAAAHQALLRGSAARGPAGWATAQAEWAAGAGLRAARFWTQLGAEALDMAEQSLKPVRQTVAANRRRLG
ncbi:hypothetical protein [Teichococcus oryzae]|uniref:Phasin family protein n=1 Tax=Teichococcus oryzae TaxID=1608942 RepID=A0A5B2TIT8_9PROT|nr:hypothetical protein [Pseudoroseomonas oryzae]KAA2214407.1 hypothetical protein F0Q34_01350 [Pseudoroseomonas oryzae]